MAELPEKPTLKDLQEHIAAFSAERGWDTNTLTETFLLFTEEVGELARAIRRVEGLHFDKAKIDHGTLEEEFADVLNYLLDLANQMKVDLETAYRDKSRINQGREWK